MSGRFADLPEAGWLLGEMKKGPRLSLAWPGSCAPSGPVLAGQWGAYSPSFSCLHGSYDGPEGMCRGAGALPCWEPPGGGGVHCLLGPSPHSQLPCPSALAFGFPPCPPRVLSEENLFWEICGLGKGTRLPRPRAERAVTEDLQL